MFSYLPKGMAAEVTLPTSAFTDGCSHIYRVYNGTAPPSLQSHINLDFEREVCGVARELTLKHLKLINSSK